MTTEYIEMPDYLDRALWLLLRPLFGDMTFAVMDVMWESAVELALLHAEREVDRVARGAAL